MNYIGDIYPMYMLIKHICMCITCIFKHKLKKTNQNNFQCHYPTSYSILVNWLIHPVEQRGRAFKAFLLMYFLFYHMLFKRIDQIQ